MIDLVEQRKADVVCVSATPPGAMMHARYLCKQLRRRLPKVKLIVGLWDVQGDLIKASERIGCGATVVATLADAQERIRLTLQQQLLPRAEQQAPAELDEPIRPRFHPSNYPSHVDVRSTNQGMSPANSVASGNSNSI